MHEKLHFSLFSLEQLEQLDASYNRIKFIPSEVGQLSYVPISVYLSYALTGIESNPIAFFFVNRLQICQNCADKCCQYL